MYSEQVWLGGVRAASVKQSRRWMRSRSWMVSGWYFRSSARWSSNFGDRRGHVGVFVLDRELALAPIAAVEITEHVARPARDDAPAHPAAPIFAHIVFESSLNVGEDHDG